MAFKKGQSGNPKGKPPGTLNKLTRAVKELAEPYGQEAINKLVHLMRKSKSEAVQKAAAEELLDRAYGKPTLPIEAEITRNYVALMPAKAETVEKWQQMCAQMGVGPKANGSDSGRLM